MNGQEIRNEMAKDKEFMLHLEAAEKWPDHAYQMRPHGLKDALFLLADIAKGEPFPDELTFRKACAIVYADHLRLEGKFFYAMEAKLHLNKKAMNELRKLPAPHPSEKPQP